MCPTFSVSKSSTNAYPVKGKPKVSVFSRYGVVLSAWFVVWWVCGTWLQHPALHRLLPGGTSSAGSVHEKPFKGHAEGSHQWPRWPNGQNLFAYCLFISVTSEETCLCPYVQVIKLTLNQHWLMLQADLMYAVLHRVKPIFLKLFYPKQRHLYMHLCTNTSYFQDRLF